MHFQPDPYIKTWLKRLLYGIILLGFCRIVFILYLFPYLKNAPVRELPMVFAAGVLFDIQALAYFLGPFHLVSLIPYRKPQPAFERMLKALFVIGTGLIILLNFIDLEFFKVKSRRSGIELFSLVTDSANPVGSYLINYWWLLLFYLLLMAAVIRFYPKPAPAQNTVKPLRAVAFFLLGAALLFAGARGSFSVKPLRSFDAARFVDPQWVSACINSPTQLLTSYSSPVPKAPSFMQSDSAHRVTHIVQSLTPYFRNEFKPNIVIIILESIGRDYCGFLNGEPRYTPFLDSLSRKSYVFYHAYSSGTTSMESIPAIFASIPSLLEIPYINSTFQNNTLYGVHHYLSRYGYDCSFYYGAANGSMGFDNFLRMSGSINYYGKNEYTGPKTDYDGNWGIWDEPYLRYFCSSLASKKQPFFSTVFTLTSHDPYKIPVQYENVLENGELPIHKAVRYTDHALRKFFEAAEKSDWFGNTVFIVTADHPSHSKNEYFYTPTGKYEIPLMIYAPGMISPGFNDSLTVSQPDIMPTVMQLAGIRDSFYAFGKSLFDTGKRTAINRDYGVPQLIDYPYCLRMFPDGKFVMHAQPKGTPNKNIRYNMNPAEQAKQKQMETLLRAKLQIYYEGLLNNSLFKR